MGDCHIKSTHTASELNRLVDEAGDRPDALLRSKSCPESFQQQRETHDSEYTEESSTTSGIENLERIDPDANVSDVQLETNQVSAGNVEANQNSTNHVSDQPHRVPTPDMPSLSDPVPSDWVVIEDDFISFVATYQKYLSSDMFTAPMSQLDDGCIHLGVIRGNTTKTKLIKCLMDMESGEHVNHEVMEMMTCKAFRLEPLTEKGIMTCDGELIEYGPIQGCILPGFSTVMGINKSP